MTDVIIDQVLDRVFDDATGLAVALLRRIRPLPALLQVAAGGGGGGLSTEAEAAVMRSGAVALSKQVRGYACSLLQSLLPRKLCCVGSVTHDLRLT